jgi:hypothetical protein
VDIASETYRRIHGSAPTAFVRERGRGPSAFVSRSFGTTDLVVCSYPGGASVAVAGQEVGTTPHVIQGARVGAPLALGLSHAGYRRHEATEGVVAVPSGVKRLDYGLAPEGAPPPRLMTEDEGKRVFSPDFRPARPFTVFVSGPAEAAPAKGKRDKKDKKPKVDKKLAERLSEIRDLVAVRAFWFQAAPTADEAEVAIDLAANPAGPSPSHVLKVRLHVGGHDSTAEAPIDLFSDSASASRILLRVAERLKSCCWTRMLEDAPAAP